VPLQDEHPEWSPAVREAIGAGKLLHGMSKQQVYYVTGGPAAVRTTEVNGIHVEFWSLRPPEGSKPGFWNPRTAVSASPPRVLRFEDGRLVRPADSPFLAAFGPND